MRAILLILLCCCMHSMAAQEDASLTTDFGRLSAKERNRIAEKEREEAAADAHFQALMADAEQLFREQRYEEAVERYNEARSRRPYNVHPKVKIQDLQALIAKRDAEARAAAPDTVQEPVLEDQVVEVPFEERPEPPLDRRPAEVPIDVPHEVPSEGRMSVGPDPVAPSDRPATPAERPATNGPVRVSPRPIPAAHQADAVEELPDGVHERIYREGRAVVLERQVVAGGTTVVYRKVTHPWGEVVHFRDGMAIPERAWNEAFGVR